MPAKATDSDADAPAAPATPAPAAAPAPAKFERLPDTPTRSAGKGKPPAAAPAAKAPAKPLRPTDTEKAAKNAEAHGRKAPAVRVTYLGPAEPVVVVGNPPMRWQKGVKTREVRDFWNADEGNQFKGITLGELEPRVVPEDSPRERDPAFKVEALPDA